MMTATTVHKSQSQSHGPRGQKAPGARNGESSRDLPTKGRRINPEPRGSTATAARRRTTSDPRVRDSQQRSSTTPQTRRRSARSQTAPTAAPARQPSDRPNRTVFSVEKALTIPGFVVAAVLILLFGLDLATRWPFHRCSPLMDLGYCMCGALLMYVSWHTYNELL
jgi:hypothetical protein